MASLNPLGTNLDLRKAKHLLRRATFNYTKEQLDSFVGMSATNAVSSLTTVSSNTLSEPYDPLPVGAPDGFWTSSLQLPNSFEGQGRKRAIATGWWWYNAMNDVGLKHKLSFFLHTCFVVGKDTGVGSATYIYDHIRLLEFYALGNIKTFAKKITLDNGMLNYLDNSQNNKNNPNENYAREYLELFTILAGAQIGEGNYTNYTEIDIQQAAKVLSGFKSRADRSDIDPDTNLPMGYINIDQHDTKDKTFTAAFNNQTITGRSTESGIFDELSDFVEMVFAQPETAKAYCRKLYRYFVKSHWTEEVETDIITPLAQLLIDSDYEILPVVTKLLSSEHFYDADDTDATDEIIGSIIKSPLQLISELCSMFSVTIPNPTTDPLNYYNNFFYKFIHNSYLNAAGMDFFNPDLVAGYPAYYQVPDYDRHWFSSNTIIGRYRLIESLIEGKNTIGSGSIYTSLDTVLFVKNKIPNASDPNLLISEIADLLYPEAIDSDRTNYFKTIIVDEGFPDYYWTNAWNQYISSNDAITVKTRLDALITAMINAPEFQLM
ncbi:uncharacterized protein (DUF1800 family) [Mariniflexile fucanivorans]|uniref:Uncharacterized protein (DUF1800 family) n=1 Tax=Mariniflexile fucanivorans TaxID=264023 RepID=A0A4R1RMJ3_9FLAO|nr:DUF1800 family protein [Mariniflexile fucanivorans]TCL67022.1 uncharacterized protein (DUF1800 family) [Mariniflexile fucanivorans]